MTDVTMQDDNNPLITVQDLFTVVKLLEDMSNPALWGGQKRLSETEIAHVKPAFDKIVAFLAEYERQVAASSGSTPTTSPILEAETELLDLSDEDLVPVVEVAATPKKAKVSKSEPKVVDKKKSTKKK